MEIFTFWSWNFTQIRFSLQPHMGATLPAHPTNGKIMGLKLTLATPVKPQAYQKDVLYHPNPLRVYESTKKQRFYEKIGSTTYPGNCQDGG